MFIQIVDITSILQEFIVVINMDYNTVYFHIFICAIILSSQIGRLSLLKIRTKLDSILIYFYSFVMLLQISFLHTNLFEPFIKSIFK